ncbi:MAG: hypothetical protein QM731_06305 [Chitinophagaceae bacterium]
MKKIILSALVLATLAMQFCTSSKKSQTAAAPAKPKLLTYEANVQPIILASCSPCHFPPKGNKKAYDNYTAVKTDIADILERIQKNPGERGFMPARHPKLSDSTINVIKQWQTDGLLEK